MRVYSRILLTFGIINIISCLVLSIYYRLQPSKFGIGTTMNSISFLVGTFAFIGMLILLGIYSLILRNNTGELITFNVYNIIGYVVFGANAIYCMFSHPNPDLGDTPAKMIANLALALLLNVSTVTMTINYLKQN